jgi:Arc/MetJ-type ribon-helix-helix transcriptional regulator
MLNTKKSRMITLRMPKELDSQLSKLSKKKFMSRSAIIKESLRKFLGGCK